MNVSATIREAAMVVVVADSKPATVSRLWLKRSHAHTNIPNAGRLVFDLTLPIMCGRFSLSRDVCTWYFSGSCGSQSATSATISSNWKATTSSSRNGKTRPSSFRDIISLRELRRLSFVILILLLIPEGTPILSLCKP